jgi:hypothetical protein
MSIHVHRTGLNQTLGQKSDAIVSTNLIGNFVPSNIGSDANAWDNLVGSGNNLRRFNGITHNNSAPHNFEFDGTDDYLGEASSGYGGSAFTVAFQNAYTISQWVYLPSTWSSGKKHYLFYFYEDSSNYVMFSLDGASVLIHSYTSSGNLANLSISPYFSPQSNKQKWVYYTITHNGSGAYKCFANGTFLHNQSTSAPSATAKALTVGKYGSSYTSANVKVGHIHVYSSALSNSQIRQNYLASHDMHNTRLYGDTALSV